MKCEKISDKVFSITGWGTLGRPQYCGNSFLGISSCGSDHAYSGIYQERHKKRNKKGGRQMVKMVFYHPINPKTPAQVVRQDKFALAVSSYKMLINQGFFDALKSATRGQKTVYHGYIRLFMKDDPIVLELFNQLN